VTTIRTTCSTCGDIELTQQHLRLELSPEWTSGHYLFTCPYCEREESRPASQRVVTILLAAGVSYEIVDSVSPLSDKEIDEFVRALDSDDWAEELLSN
jgi:hypothetical protein